MVVLLWALSSGCFFFMVQSDDKINRNHHIFYVNTKKMTPCHIYDIYYINIFYGHVISNFDIYAYHGVDELTH